MENKKLPRLACMQKRRSWIDARPRLRGADAGFTLLETMIAMAIMLVAFASILMVQSSSITATAKAKQINIVTMLAKGLMIETEFEMEGKNFDELPKEKTGQFKEPYQDFTWVRTVNELKFPSLNIGGGGTGGEGGDQAAAGGDQGDDGAQNATAETLTKLVTNFLSKSIREVTVTIKWKKGTGEQSYSVSTYWVDLNHEFQLSE